jgi:hypothetical protein
LADDEDVGNERFVRLCSDAAEACRVERVAVARWHGVGGAELRRRITGQGLRQRGEEERVEEQTRGGGGLRRHGEEECAEERTRGGA